MLSFARVLMILAGFCGLPSVVCSLVWSGLSVAAELPSEGQTFYRILFYASLIASLGAIFVGAKAKSLGKAKTAISCLTFAACYTGLILQLNLFGFASAGMLLLAAIMTFVASEAEFRGVVRVEVST